MGVVNFQFMDGEVQTSINANALELLKVLTIVTHELKSGGVEAGVIAAAVFAGANESIYNKIADSTKPVGDGVSISSNLAELLRKLGDK